MLCVTPQMRSFLGPKQFTDYLRQRTNMFSSLQGISLFDMTVDRFLFSNWSKVFGHSPSRNKTNMMIQSIQTQPFFLSLVFYRAFLCLHLLKSFFHSLISHFLVFIWFFSAHCCRVNLTGWSAFQCSAAQYSSTCVEFSRAILNRSQILQAIDEGRPDDQWKRR